jgi:hypothetical protein
MQSLLPRQEMMPKVCLIDSMPMVMASGSRCNRACVAPELASVGYCASKPMWFYGLSLHCIVEKCFHRLPRFRTCACTPAAEHDVQTLRQQIDHLHQCDVYGDKAYFYHDVHTLAENNHTVIWAIKPRVRGQESLPVDERLCNASIARMRQPIESFFNWLNEHTKIQSASKVRSAKGVIVHVLGRLAAAVLLLILNF